MKWTEIGNCTKHPAPSSRSIQKSQSRKDYIFKNLFHGLRYLDFAEQLIRTKSIHDFKRVLYVYEKMKVLREDPTDSSSMQRVARFVREKSNEFKSKLDALVPTNIVKGTFKAYITFDCIHNTEQVINELTAICKNTKFKISFIQLHSEEVKDCSQQLMVSFNCHGGYPSIVKQIEEEAFEFFRDFSIIRIKIEALASNEGVPETNIDKRLFWSNTTNYFEFHYKVLVKNDHKEDNVKKLQDLCGSNYRFKLHLSRNAFKQVDEESFHYLVTMRLFDEGREEAMGKNDATVEYLTIMKFPPLKVVREFVVHDSNIGLDIN